MVNSVNSFQINATAVEQNQVPTVSDTTKQIFKEHAFQAPLVSIADMSDYSKDVQTLQGLTDQLNAVHSHATREKVLAFLKALIPVAILAAGILISLPLINGFYYDGSAALSALFALASTILYFGMNLSAASKYLEDGKVTEGICSFLVPLFVAFSRSTAHLETAIENQTQLVQHHHDELQGTLDASFKQFNTNVDAVRTTLKDEMQKTRNSLATVQSMTIKTKAGEQELQDRIEMLQKASQEVEQMHQFFAKFA